MLLAIEILLRQITPIARGLGDDNQRQPKRVKTEVGSTLSPQAYEANVFRSSAQSCYYPDSASQSGASAVINLTPLIQSPRMPVQEQQQLVAGGARAPKDPRRDFRCIGQISATAHITYPANYICPRPGRPAHPLPPTSDDFVPVRLGFDANTRRQENSHQRRQVDDDNIQISVPRYKGGASGSDTLGGEEFGMIEQRVATVLYPLMQKVLIRLTAHVRRAETSTADVLPLRILVFTVKGNVNVVASYLRNGNLYLEHPTLPYNPAEHRDSPPYENPHQTLTGGVSRTKTGTKTKTKTKASADMKKPIQEQRVVQIDDISEPSASGAPSEDTAPETTRTNNIVAAAVVEAHNSRQQSTIPQQTRLGNSPNTSSVEMHERSKISLKRPQISPADHVDNINQPPAPAKRARIISASSEPHDKEYNTLTARHLLPSASTSTAPLLTSTEASAIKPRERESLIDVVLDLNIDNLRLRHELEDLKSRSLSTRHPAVHESTGAQQGADHLMHTNDSKVFIFARSEIERLRGVNKNSREELKAARDETDRLQAKNKTLQAEREKLRQMLSDSMALAGEILSLEKNHEPLVNENT